MRSLLHTWTILTLFLWRVNLLWPGCSWCLWIIDGFLSFFWHFLYSTQIGERSLLVMRAVTHWSWINRRLKCWWKKRLKVLLSFFHYHRWWRRMTNRLRYRPFWSVFDSLRSHITQYRAYLGYYAAVCFAGSQGWGQTSPGQRFPSLSQR